MIIYKYLDEEGTIKTLKNNSVLLRCPIEYNDPFDCLFYVSKEEQKKAYDLYVNYIFFEKLYEEVVINNKKMNCRKSLKPILLRISKSIKKDKKYVFQYDLHMYYAIAKKLLKTNDSALKKGFMKELEDEMVKIRNIALVSCFGLNNNSLLMWSHYANKHRGACLEYEVDNEVFKKVEYSNKLRQFKMRMTMEVILGHKFINEEIDDSKPEYQFVLDPLFVKSVDWGYEEEIRCVFSKNKRMPNNEGLYLLEMPLAKRIIVGCRASEDFVLKIKEVAPQIPLVKAKMSEDEYKIILE